MPTLDEMRLDGQDVHDQIVKELYRMEENMRAVGFAPMTPQELRYAYAKIKTGVAQAVKPRTPPRPLQPMPMAAPTVPMSAVAEGGFINDASGQATEQARNRLGIR